MASGKNYGMILLAAGNSSRLGRPKALLPYRNATLIAHIAKEMQQLALPMVAVTGGDAADVTVELKNAGVTTCYNPFWQEGMAASVRIGLSTMLARHADIEGILLAVCDQPYVSARLFSALIAEKQTCGKRIVASAYADTLGTPVVFDRFYFSELLALQGKGGAKPLLYTHAADCVSVFFPEGAVDIDTEADYDALLLR